MRPEVWERVKEIFEEISDSTPEDRRRALERAGDEVRPEVERMLASYDDSRQSTTSCGLVPEGALLAALIRDQHTFEEGQVLVDRFEIRRLLGSGGMGEVYEAWDRNLGEVAVKTLRLELTTAKPTIQNFQREVERGRRVTHPNVCRIYDLFWTEGGENFGTPFFTMELLSGETLLSAIGADGGLDERRGLAIAIELCEGLQAAHDAFIIHGDFKSGNVILARQADGSIQSKITDFGLARLAHWAADPGVASTGPVEGTRQYLALETMSGSPPSIASDLFALGVVLFQIRTGRYPFASDANWEQTREMRMKPPSLRDLMIEAGSNWGRAIAPCLDPDPSKRPSSAAEVCKILTDLGPEHHLTRRQLFFGLAGIGVVAVGSESFIRKYLGPPDLPNGRLRTLVADFTTSGASPAVGRAVRNLMRLHLNSSNRIAVIPPSEIHQALEAFGTGAQPLTGAASRSVAARTRAAVLVQGAVRAEGSGYAINCEAMDPKSGAVLFASPPRHTGAQQLPSAVRALSSSLRQRLGAEVLAAFALNPTDEADTTNSDALENFSLGLAFYDAGQRDAALEKLNDATRIDPNFAVAYAYQSTIHLSAQHDELALEPCAKAYALRDRLNAHHRLTIEYLHSLMLGDFGKVHRQLLLLAQLFPDDPNLNRHLAQSFALMEQPELCLERSRRAAQLDPDNPLNQSLLMSALAENGRAAEADEAIRSARNRFPDAPPVLFGRAYVHALNLEPNDALSILDDLARRYDPAPSANTLIVKVLMLSGRLQDARVRLERDIPVRAYAGDKTLEDQYRYWLGQTAFTLGDSNTAAQQAEALLQREPSPLFLDSFRGAAELAWLSGNDDLSGVAVQKLQQLQRSAPSDRSQGFLMFSKALKDGDPDCMGRACSFWPDLTSRWAYGELLLEHQRHSEALSSFLKVTSARSSALRFASLNLWVRSLARAALCLNVAQHPAEASVFSAQFEKLWGAPASYRFARVANAITVSKHRNS